jgi:hypothetical protein
MEREVVRLGLTLERGKSFVFLLFTWNVHRKMSESVQGE